MSVKDITPLRPAYLSWTLFRDYHYTVFNSAGEPCLLLVTTKGEKLSYYVKAMDFDPMIHAVVYENYVERARYHLSTYVRESKDLLEALKRYEFPEGQYGMSVVDASGKRLYTFDLYI